MTAAGNVPRVVSMLAEAASAVTVVPLDLPHVSGMPSSPASTAELSADGAELLKVALDGTRPQVAKLLGKLRPDAVVFDFTVPWVSDITAPLGAKALFFNVCSAASFAWCPGTVPRRASPVGTRTHEGPCRFPVQLGPRDSTSVPGC